MIVLDASVLIAHISPEDAFHERATELLEQLEEFDFAASTLTVAECLVHAADADRVTTVLGIFERLNLIQVELTRSETAGIAEIRKASKLRMPDAVVLHTAEAHGAELATADRALARAAETRGVTAYLLEA
jgi:predicted nucleic acid-binding protein